MRGYGIGRLTKDIEVKCSATGTAYLTNSIACDRKFSKEKQTDFFNIKVFGKTAEAMGKFLHKGSKIFVEGSLQTDEYTTKDGQKKSSISLYVDSWEFAEAKGEAKEEKPDFISVPEGLVEELPFS